MMCMCVHLGVGQIDINPVRGSLIQPASASLPPLTHTHPSIQTVLLLLMKPPLYMVMSFTPERHQEGMIALCFHTHTHTHPHTHTHVHTPSHCCNCICSPSPPAKNTHMHTNMRYYSHELYIFSPSLCLSPMRAQL